MSDRRPPQRPASSAARRPAPSGARPSGSRPSGGSGSRRPAPRRGGKHASGRFFVFLGIVAVVIIAVVLLIWQPWAATPAVNDQTADATQPPIAPVADSTQTDQTQAENTAAPDNATALSEMLGSEGSDIQGLSEEEMVQVSDLSVNTSLSPEWQNILLLGVDQRTPNESCRSDTMIICSINTQTSEVKLTSLMRDIAVDYTDLGSNNGTYRLNAANYFGGPELTMKTINELLGMNIEKYVMVNFTGFTQICEALGGIEIDITEEEMEQININSWNQYQIGLNNGWDESNLESTNEALTEYGENTHLNGRQALAYARIRKIDSDWERTNRQRKVLVAMMEKLEGTSAMELLQLGMTLQQYVETNMTLDEIVSTAERVLNSGLSGAETMVIPVTDTYTQETRNGQSMFYDVDWVTNTRELQNFIYY
ncbi:MAG TPA: LCP family protein [Candidatus Pullichristensenella stercorigallinarum]|uniref:LCP family protein n=1 Tax=Candidatus Pullichristensenella stercorigallinarum TaxID=2840909 RepID=A0A9D0ZNM6_9FIRM|nr:LCP family protein [Candidatus Pullichristensenella stercorigallinarum]